MNAASRRNFGLAALGLIVLGGLAWLIATQGPLAPIRVTVAKAQEITLTRSILGIGTVEARHSYAIGPTVAGRVAVVSVDHGDRVTAGQVLAEMDPVDLDAREAASGATTARASQLAAAAQASLSEAQSRAQLAQSSADRYADLRKKNFVSQEASDAKQHDAAAARAAREAASAALAAAKDEERRARLEQTGVGKSRAHLRLKSPVTGVVSARLAEPGSTVVAGQSVLQVIDPATLWLKVRVDQGRAAGVAIGMPAEIRLRSKPREALRGHVARVDLVGDAIAEERVVNVAFDALPTDLITGELAEVRLMLPAVEKALAVPAAAIRRQGNGEGLWLVQDGRSVFAPARTGISSSDGMIQILEGIAPGAEVIVHSQRAIAANARLRIVDSLAKAAQ